jgi:hypothetical protein
MTDTTKPNDGHLASKELKWAHGWVQTAQRTGRYSYRKVMAHVTNPDHYEASRVAPGSPPLKMAARYAAGRPRLARRT